MESTAYIDEYLAIVFGTKDKAEIAERILNSPTLSEVREAYNDFEKFSTVRGYKVVPAYHFMEYICATYGLWRKTVPCPTPDRNAQAVTIFCKRE